METQNTDFSVFCPGIACYASRVDHIGRLVVGGMISLLERMMGNIERLGNKINVPIRVDADGFLGRECPRKECEQYFKLTPGTGLTEVKHCHCPYCGHKGSADEFFTKEQIEHAKSVALHRVTDAFLKDLKRLEFDHKPRGTFGIGISMKVQGRPHPIRPYSERELETHIVCDCCTLRYAIYGVFAYCPDCGVHNSFQILAKNLDLAEKQVDLAVVLEGELAASVVSDALENVVSVFDGFGREFCRVHAAMATDQSVVQEVSFQNLPKARKRILTRFGFDFAQALSPEEWQLACRGFQKRHLLAHKMGVVDEEYVRAASDSNAVIGRKVSVSSDEVRTLIALVRKLGGRLAAKVQPPA